eukprot:TRINITY_DN935_c0_g1_i1.p2 TRINITY_DN935_c0_g1~~TRINITY_DN935_c0_g1_i1.p2  ORF type:complete len:129 (-),score=1.86 TRINITY_DN935_c0_g1_i1:485-871(-)
MVVKLRVHPFPETRCCSRSDCDTTLLFLLHPIHSCGAIMYFTDLMRKTCVEQNTFCCGGFACIYVSYYADITVALKWSCTCHMILLKVKDRLPTVMCECFIRFSHTVNVFTFLNRSAFVISSVNDFLS